MPWYSVSNPYYQCYSHSDQGARVPLTGCICDLHTQYKHESGIVRSCQIVADQPTDAMLSWNKAEAKGASKVGNQVDQNEDAASVIETVIQEDTR